MADKASAVDPVPQEKPWQRELRLQRQNLYRGSQYPPMSIEPFPHERQRLSGEGMTDADRALRRQWLKDQELSPNEPRFVPEIKPRNKIKRIYHRPFDFIFGKLRPIIGDSAAALGRITVPRILMAAGGVYLAYYQLKYHPNDWTKVGGFAVTTNKPMILDDREMPPEKEASDFAERGFKSRTVLLDGKTSFNNY